MSGQIQYITIVDSKCCGGVPTSFEIPIGATPHEIATITGASIERAIELWETRIADRPDLCPIIYFNEAIVRTLTKNNCPIGQTGTEVTVEIPEGFFSSQLSQQDANYKAELYFKEVGQKMANDMGTCIVPDCSSCNEYRVSKTVACGEFRIKTSCINGKCTDIGNEFFVCLTGNCTHTTCIEPCINCSPTCPNGDCPSGFTCNQGKCVALCDGEPCSLKCLTGNCPAGQTCVSGKCQDIASNTCITCSLTCPTGSCPPNHTCVNGKCEANCAALPCSLTCLNGTCPSGETCIGGSCKPVNQTPCIKCSQTCPNGTCDSGFTCVNGNCAANCENAPCSIACLNGNCPTGETCSGGTCVPIASSTCISCRLTCPTGSCQPGYKCVNGTCIIDCFDADCSSFCPSGKCPSGQNCVNGSCQNPPPPPPSPTVQTNSATNITQTTVVLNGSVNPNGFATTVYFEYSTSSDLSNSVIQTVNQSVGSGTTILNRTANITGLTSSTTYYYRIVATNANGTTNGQIVSFVTSQQIVIPPPPPPPTTEVIIYFDDLLYIQYGEFPTQVLNFVNNQFIQVLNNIINSQNVNIHLIFRSEIANKEKVNVDTVNNLRSAPGFIDGRWLTYFNAFKRINNLNNKKLRLIIMQDRSSDLVRLYNSGLPTNNFSHSLINQRYDITGTLSGGGYSLSAANAKTNPILTLTSNITNDLNSYFSYRTELINAGNSDIKISFFPIPVLNQVDTRLTFDNQVQTTPEINLLQRFRNLFIASNLINGVGLPNTGGLSPTSYRNEIPPISTSLSPTVLNTVNWNYILPLNGWSLTSIPSNTIIESQFIQMIQ